MTITQNSLPADQYLIDRTDVTEFNRRIDAMSVVVSSLATAVAVQNERESQKALALTNALRDRELKVDIVFAEMKDDIKAMKDVFSTGRAAVWILASLGGVVMFFLLFWEKLKLIIH